MSTTDRNHYIFLILSSIIVVMSFLWLNAKHREERLMELHDVVRSEIRSNNIASNGQVEQILKVMGEFVSKSEYACFVLTDKKGKVTFLDSNAEHVLDVSIGSDVEEFIPPELRDNHRRVFQDSVSSSQEGISSLTDVKCRVAVKDGSDRFARVQAFPYSNGAGAFITVYRDEKYEEPVIKKE